MKLEIIIASTRPERLGDQVGAWVTEYAKEHSNFDVGVADLAEINLPMFDEPMQPMMKRYEKDHTKAWSARIEAADAFVVVTPEYNHMIPPSLVNAFDFLHHEWKYKPVGFVGYGGTGALRAVQTGKLLFVDLSAMPIAPTVALMGVFAPVVKSFVSEEKHDEAAGRMFDELEVWAETLQPMRLRLAERAAAARAARG